MENMCMAIFLKFTAVNSPFNIFLFQKKCDYS